MSPASAWFGCADSARLRADPLVGTAPYALGWLLIEHPGPWKPDALDGSGITGSVRQVLTQAARSSGSRILLIRRPGRQPTTDVRRWAAVNVEGGAVWGTWRVDQDLVAAARALTGPADDARVADPILLVCTHGMHDAPAPYAGAGHRGPGRTVAGDDLGMQPCRRRPVRREPGCPSYGAYYGNLDSESAVTTVREHLAGRLAIPYLRGLAGFPPVAQAAISAAHESYGPWGAADVAVLDMVERPRRIWEVGLGSAGALRAMVSLSPRAEAKLACHAALETSATQYQVTDLAPMACRP